MDTESNNLNKEDFLAAAALVRHSLQKTRYSKAEVFKLCKLLVVLDLLAETVSTPKQTTINNAK